MTAAIEDFGPGPLPVIKAICVELGMIDTLNELLTWGETQCELSPGHRLLALIMNVLTEGQPMYRLSAFFEGTDVENLFGHGVEPEDLNNHACARALDKLADAESSTVLGTVLLRAADAEDISCNVLHADTTSFSVHGVYETESDDDTSKSGMATAPTTAAISGSSKSASVSTEPAFPSSERSSTGTPTTRPGTPS